jgi:ligand-binding sensor domain-containing protein
LPDLPVNAVAVNDNGDIYIGTDIGVFYREEGGTSWMPFFNGLPKVPVTDLQITNSYIYASTFGRGIWGSSTHGNCPLR